MTNLPKYYISYSFRGYGTTEIEADTENEAIDKFYEGEYSRDNEDTDDYEVDEHYEVDENGDRVREVERDEPDEVVDEVIRSYGIRPMLDNRERARQEAETPKEDEEEETLPF